MNCCNHTDGPGHGKPRFAGWRRFALFAAVPAAMLAWNYHVALLAYLPYLLVLLCPLMHVFMMRGHGHGHGDQPRTDGNSGTAREPPAALPAPAHADHRPGH